MTGAAALEPHRGVFEGKRPTFIGVTPKAAGLVGGESTDLLRPEGSMRVVAIDTGHRALRKTVSMGPLKLRPRAGMTACTLPVHLGRLGGPKRGWRSMYLMASGTRDLPLRVAALQAARVSGLVQVASEAELIGLAGSKFGRVPDVPGSGRLSVRACGPMARFASLPHPAKLRLRVDRLMRIPQKGIEDILMTGLTRLRSDVLRLLTQERNRECAA